MDDGNKLEIDANLMFEGIISIFLKKKSVKGNVCQISVWLAHLILLFNLGSMEQLKIDFVQMEADRVALKEQFLI